jgi:hypothetical protein
MSGLQSASDLHLGKSIQVPLHGTPLVPGPQRCVSPHWLSWLQLREPSVLLRGHGPKLGEPHRPLHALRSALTGPDLLQTE